MSCEECIKLHKKRRKPTPCNTPKGCPKPFLDPGNYAVWELYKAISEKPNIVGMGAYIGADLQILPMVAEAHGFPPSEFRLVLDKILILNNINRRIWQEEQERKNTAEKNRRELDDSKRGRGKR